MEIQIIHDFIKSKILVKKVNYANYKKHIIDIRL